MSTRQILLYEWQKAERLVDAAAAACAEVVSAGMRLTRHELDHLTHLRAVASDRLRAMRALEQDVRAPTRRRRRARWSLPSTH